MKAWILRTPGSKQARWAMKTNELWEASLPPTAIALDSPCLCCLSIRSAFLLLPSFVYSFIKKASNPLRISENEMINPNMLSAQGVCMLCSFIAAHNRLPLMRLWTVEGHCTYSRFVQGLAYLYHKFKPFGIVVVNPNLTISNLNLHRKNKTEQMADSWVVGKVLTVVPS